MIDISGKPPTQRVALAQARVILSQTALDALRQGALPKGDAVAVARIAGIMAAKHCADLIPYCHPIPLKHVDVTVVPTDACVEITAAAKAEASTGVEMEALTAVAVAALTVYDMCKALDPEAIIQDLCVLRKSGGKTGDWQRADWPAPESR